MKFNNGRGGGRGDINMRESWGGSPRGDMPVGASISAGAPIRGDGDRDRDRGDNRGDIHISSGPIINRNGNVNVNVGMNDNNGMNVGNQRPMMGTGNSMMGNNVTVGDRNVNNGSQRNMNPNQNHNNNNKQGMPLAPKRIVINDIDVMKTIQLRSMLVDYHISAALVELGLKNETQPIQIPFEPPSSSSTSFVSSKMTNNMNNNSQMRQVQGQMPMLQPTLGRQGDSGSSSSMASGHSGHSMSMQQPQMMVRMNSNNSQHSQHSQQNRGFTNSPRDNTNNKLSPRR